MRKWPGRHRYPRKETGLPRVLGLYHRVTALTENPSGGRKCLLTRYESSSCEEYLVGFELRTIILRHLVIRFSPLCRTDSLDDLLHNLVLFHPLLDAPSQTLKRLVILIQLDFRTILPPPTALTDSLLSCPITFTMSTKTPAPIAAKKQRRTRTLRRRPRLSATVASSWLFLWTGEDSGP